MKIIRYLIVGSLAFVFAGMEMSAQTAFDIANKDSRLASEHSKKASKLRSARNYDEAIVELSEAIRLQPNEYSYVRDRAELLEKTRKFERAVEDYKTLIKLAPWATRLWHSQAGNCYYDLGKYRQAIDEWNTALAIADSDKDARTNAYLVARRGRAHLALGDRRKALDDAASAISISPKYSGLAHGIRADVLVLEGRYDAAVEEYGQAIFNSSGEADGFEFQRARALARVKAGKLDKAFADVDALITRKIVLGREYYVLRGDLHMIAGRHAAALADADAAIEYLKEFALITNPAIQGDAFRLRAEAQCALGKAAEAKASEQEAVKLGGTVTKPCRGADTAVKITPDKETVVQNPPSLSAHYTQGMEHFNEGRHAEAIESFSKAIAADPKRPEYFAARAKVNIWLRKLPAALEDINRSLGAGSTYEAYALRANIHLERGSFDKAISDLAKGAPLLKGPENVEAVFNHHAALAGINALLGKAAEYKSNVEAAEKAMGFFSDTQYDHSLNDKASGLYGLALAKFSAAIADRPDRIEFLAERGQIWIELGKLKEALADFDASLVIAPKKIYIQVYRGKTLILMKRYAEALAAVDIALDGLPADDHMRMEANQVRAAANCALGNKEEAAIDESIFESLGGKLKTPCR